MDAYNNLNQIAFKLMNEMSDDSKENEPEIDESAALMSVVPRNEKWTPMVASIMSYLTSVFKKDIKDSVRLQDDVEGALKPIIDKFKQREGVVGGTANTLNKPSVSSLPPQRPKIGRTISTVGEDKI